MITMVIRELWVGNLLSDVHYSIKSANMEAE